MRLQQAYLVQKSHSNG